MEFTEFCKERERMCEYYNGQCESNACPLYEIKNNNLYHRCDFGSILKPEEAEKAVFEWSKEHPIVTNRKKFKEVFGFNIMVKPENEGDFLIKKDELLDRIDGWLQQEYKPPQK